MQTLTNAVSLDVSCIRLIAIYHQNDEMLIPFLRLHYISGGAVAIVIACGTAIRQHCLAAGTALHSFQFEFEILVQF